MLLCEPSVADLRTRVHVARVVATVLGIFGTLLLTYGLLIVGSIRFTHAAASYNAGGGVLAEVALGIVFVVGGLATIVGAEGLAVYAGMVRGQLRMLLELETLKVGAERQAYVIGDVLEDELRHRRRQ